MRGYRVCDGRGIVGNSQSVLIMINPITASPAVKARRRWPLLETVLVPTWWLGPRADLPRLALDVGA
jgi:hypothetical protein